MRRNNSIQNGCITDINTTITGDSFLIFLVCFAQTYEHVSQDKHYKVPFHYRQSLLPLLLLCNKRNDSWLGSPPKWYLPKLLMDHPVELQAPQPRGKPSLQRWWVGVYIKNVLAHESLMCDKVPATRKYFSSICNPLHSFPKHSIFKWLTQVHT